MRIWKRTELTNSNGIVARIRVDVRARMMRNIGIWPHHRTALGSPDTVDLMTLKR